MTHRLTEEFLRLLDRCVKRSDHSLIDHKLQSLEKEALRKCLDLRKFSYKAEPGISFTQ